MTASITTRAGKGSELTHNEVDANFTALQQATDRLEKNDQTGTTYTLVLTDAGKIVPRDNAASNTTTVPPNSSVAFPVGTVIFIRQKGAGASSVLAGSGVTINFPAGGGLSIATQHKVIALMKDDTDTWSMHGGKT